MNMHRALQDQHSLPIQRMGDIESYLRQKYDLEYQEDVASQYSNDGSQQPQANSGILQMMLYYLRDPKIDDQQNMLLHRPYCGNPFVAPGTIGSKTRRPGGASNMSAASQQEEDQAELGGHADEAAFFNHENNNSMDQQQ